MPNVDALIVGQGLAGSVLAHRWLDAGAEIRIIDADLPAQASRAAAGIMEPVSGKRLAKFPAADSLIPAAVEFYKELEKKLQTTFLSQKIRRRFFADAEEIEIFQKKRHQSEFRDDLAHPFPPGEFFDTVANPLGGFESAVWCLDTPHFLARSRNYFETKKILMPERFRFAEWKNVSARHLIFCDGYRFSQNPFFAHIPARHAKGVVLKGFCKELPQNVIWNNGKWLLSLPDGEFKFGATYDRDDLSELPDEPSSQSLLAELKNFLKLPFDVRSFDSGVRPSTRDFRPLVGLHPRYPRVGILNGLGSKGVMTAPSCALALIEQCRSQKRPPAQFDVARYGPGPAA